MPTKRKTKYTAPTAPPPPAPERQRVAPVPVPQPTAPALPDVSVLVNPLEVGLGAAAATDSTLPGGCYLLKYTPAGVTNLHYDGTLRVQPQGTGFIASGDLYLHGNTMAATEPNPSAGIPIYAIGRYRYYIRVIAIRFFPFDTSVRPTFELHRFNSGTRTWTNEGEHVAIMNRRLAPAAYPFPGEYLEGTVFRPNGTTVGSLTMGLVSRHLRRATVEVDRVAASEAPLENGDGVNWQTIGDQVGWKFTVIESDSDVAEPSGEGWSNAEMHAAMLARRDSSDLDSEWRYHVLAVRIIDSTPRGVMYDNGGTDSNNVPREGMGIASHWIIPNQDPWGLVKGVRFGLAKKPYFRTVVHEIGHAMGLYHNTVDNGIMNTTDVISAAGTAANPFPNNIQWSHAADDQKRLRHMPDIYVRPGGLPFGTAYNAVPVSPGDQIGDDDALEMEVTSLMDVVPIGAPVRVDFALKNVSPNTEEVPASLSMSSGFVRGTVTDPGGTVRTFLPIVVCVDEEPMAPLAPGASLAGSATLLRGAEGSLFPMAGPHKVSVEAVWEDGGTTRRVAGASIVMVTGPVDDAHARVASQVLSCPDALLTLVFGGDHLPDGIAAVEAGMSHDALRPHYAYTQAKRLCQGFGDRKADLKAASNLLGGDSVMSSSEMGRVAEIVGKKGGNASIGRTLKAKLGHVEASDEVRRLVEAL